MKTYKLILYIIIFFMIYLVFEYIYIFHCNKLNKSIKSNKKFKKKKINTIKIKNIENITFDLLKNNTLNFKEPLILKLENNENLKIKDYNKFIIKNYDLISVENRKTLKYENKKSEDFNNEDYSIFNHTIKKDYVKDIIPLLNYNILFGNYFENKKGDITGIHNELNSTINIQISGKKRWILVNPDNTEYVFPMKNNWRSYFSYFCKRQIRDNELKYIPHYDIILKKNEILFIPAWFWHHIITLENNSKSLSLRTLFKNSTYNSQFFPNGILTSLIEQYILNTTHDEKNPKINEVENLFISLNHKCIL